MIILPYMLLWKLDILMARMVIEEYFDIWSLSYTLLWGRVPTLAFCRSRNWPRCLVSRHSFFPLWWKVLALWIYGYKIRPRFFSTGNSKVLWFLFQFFFFLLLTSCRLFGVYWLPVNKVIYMETANWVSFVSFHLKLYR